MPAPEDQNNISQTSFKGDFAERFSLISDDLEAVKKCISKGLVTGSKVVDERLSYVASATGKMVRPALVLLCAKCCGVKASGQHVGIASIIETMHIATLLHDDVIDHAESRRNVETANSIWGNESAVLLGDFLLARAFAMSSTLEDKRISRVLANTAMRICQGELLQNANRDNWRLSQKEYFEIIESKTASLFGASCGLGAIAAGADNETEYLFTNFGLSLGMAFQVADDLIDITGLEKGEGKTLGRDIAEKKSTLPLIHLISTLKDDEADRLVKDLSDGQIPDDYEQMLAKSGSLEYSRNAARDYCDKAVDYLKKVDSGEFKDMLVDIVKIVMERAISN